MRLSIATALFAVAASVVPHRGPGAVSHVSNQHLRRVPSPKEMGAQDVQIDTRERQHRNPNEMVNNAHDKGPGARQSGKNSVGGDRKIPASGDKKTQEKTDHGDMIRKAGQDRDLDHLGDHIIHAAGADINMQGASDKIIHGGDSDRIIHRAGDSPNSDGLMNGAGPAKIVRGTKGEQNILSVNGDQIRRQHSDMKRNPERGARAEGQSGGEKLRAGETGAMHLQDSDGDSPHSGTVIRAAPSIHSNAANNNANMINPGSRRLRLLPFGLGKFASVENVKSTVKKALVSPVARLFANNVLPEPPAPVLPTRK